MYFRNVFKMQSGRIGFGSQFSFRETFPSRFPVSLRSAASGCEGPSAFSHPAGVKSEQVAFQSETIASEVKKNLISNLFSHHLRAARNVPRCFCTCEG